MKVSVFTPVHKFNTEYLDELYGSIEEADEWVVLLNGKATKNFKQAQERYPNATIHTTKITGNIGALKSACVSLCTGDICVEVDYDDYLTEDAISHIRGAFENENVQFVYSNCVQFDETGKSVLYDPRYGWQTRNYKGFTQLVAFPEQAQYMRRIEWAPNHVRAFRRTAYDAIGGYNRKLIGGDDHDLVCRFYIAYGEAGFKHIDECLYMYRNHGGNTCKRSNPHNILDTIQKQVDINYINHAEKMYLRWAQDNGLPCFNLGAGKEKKQGYKSVDIKTDAEIIADLELDWPWENDSVGIFRAYHVLEHLQDPIHFFNEAYRCLAPGGFLLIEVPSTNGSLAFADPTHIRFYNSDSFAYYTLQQKAAFIQPEYKGRFQAARVTEYLWNENPRHVICSANLIALKGWYDQRWCGYKGI